MTPGNSHKQRARYDEDGNIVLSLGASPSPERPRIEAERIEHAAFSFAAEPVAEPVREADIDALQWGLPEEPSEDISNLPVVVRQNARRRVADQLTAVRASVADALDDAEHEAVATAKRLLEEGERQVRSTVEDGIDASYGALDELRSILRSFKRFVTQPVLVPVRRNHVKRYSRGALFAIDIARFGGTFAAIFALLFSAMNYESFAAIASARIEPILSFTNLDGSASAQKSLAEKLRHVPSLPTAGDGDEGLAAHLPLVGPPDDLLIIPKLNLRSPIITVPTDSLVREDWKQLETDIQRGLENGVVHYPGTAEAGQAGNFFLTGHSSYFPWASGKYKSIFARLGELDVGDEFWVYHGGDKYRYVIDTKKEILPSDVTVLDQPVGKRIATLMTCTPVGTTLRRLILTAQELDPVTGEPMEVGAHQKQEQRPPIKLDALPI
jgi:LPXTG-site transpeptidase (sortase) family protein